MSARPFLLLGVVHLTPLPGAPRFSTSIDQVIERAEQDARALLDGGFHGVIVENFGDAPFYPDHVPPITVAAMAVASRAVASIARAGSASRRYLGINVLRNDAAAALSIAASVGADFVRINVHQGAVVADQGLIIGRAHESARLRAQLAPQLCFYCDVRVKHAAPLAARELRSEVGDLIHRGLADAVLVTGAATASPIDLEHLELVHRAAAGTPVLMASGVTADSLATQAPHADGAIIGTACEQDGEPGAPVDPQRVKRVIEAWRALQRPAPQAASWSCA